MKKKSNKIFIPKDFNKYGKALIKSKFKDAEIIEIPTLWLNEPLPIVPIDKIIPDITNPVKNIKRLLNKKHGKGVKTNASK